MAAVTTLAFPSKKTLGPVVSELARRELKADMKTKRKNGLPTFQVPKNTPTIPSARARKLLAEDPK